MKYIKLFENFDNIEDVLEDIKWILVELDDNPELLRNELNWQPEYTFETMLDEMIKYWLEYYGK